MPVITVPENVAKFLEEVRSFGLHESSLQFRHFLDHVNSSRDFSSVEEAIHRMNARTSSGDVYERLIEILREFRDEATDEDS
ncbi:hypothetical protein J7I98_37760 [Streptomyces sp. ISL-98]|uniref:hypothetical protein n=1 Tax=Streptomyces sp. ISL-98 TaxID=2819192 RepID=UPI001BE62AFC|nr:hypothetical protein [Streptomyces sp. ISL-98]MBT2511450.1 hypothetical protein [Streptomyces sp. ISL-98]